MTTNNSSRWRRVARVSRYLSIALIALIALVVVALTLPPVRGALLMYGISVAGRELPGILHVGDARWQELGSIQLEDVSWADGPNVFARADRVAVSVRLRSLLSKDIEVDSVEVSKGYVSLPKIVAAFAAMHPPPQPEEGDDRRFPRGGSLPGLPSLAVHEMSLRMTEAEFADSIVIRDVVVEGAFNLLADEPAQIALERVEAIGADGTWSIGELALNVDFEQGLLDGRARGLLPREAAFEMLLEPAGRDSFALHLWAGGDPTNRILIEADGHLRRDGLDVQSIASVTRIRVPGTRVLASSAILGGAVNALPDLEGVTLTATTNVQLDPFALDSQVHAEPNSWLTELRATVGIDKDGVGIDVYGLGMPGVSASGHVYKLGTGLDAASTVRVTDSRWLGHLAPGLESPSRLSGSVDIRAAGPLDALDVTIAAKDLAYDTLDLHRFDASGRVLLAETVTASLSLALTTLGLDIYLETDIEKGDDMTALVSPIVVREDGFAARPGAHRASIRYGSDRTLTAEDVRIEGAAGDMRISAALDSSMTGEVGLSLSWSDLPPALLRIAGGEPDSLAGLNDALYHDAPYSIDMAARLDGRTGTIRVVAPFTLPGPRNLRPLLPDSLEVGDLGPLRGSITAIFDRNTEPCVMEVALDLAATDWVDSSHVHIVHRGGSTEVKSLLLDVFGVSVHAVGVVGDTSDLRADIVVPNTNSISRFSPRVPSATLRASAIVTGAIADPFVSTSFDGSVTSGDYVIPRIEGVVDYHSRGLRVDVVAPEGVQAGDMSLSKVELEAESDAGGGRLLPVRMDLRVDGSDFEWFHSLVVDTTDGLRIDVDTLGTVIAGGDLRSRGPFTLGTIRSDDAFYAEGLQLSGTLGEVRAGGYASTDSARIEADIDLSLPAAPASLGIPTNLWPRRLLLKLGVDSPNDINASLRLRGFVIGDGRQPELSTDLWAHNDSLRVTVAMSDSAAQYLEVNASLPARVIAYPPQAEVLVGAFAVDATFSNFPLVVYTLNAPRAIPEGEVADIDARILLGGTTGHPSGNATARVSFPDWPKLSPYQLRADATLAKGGVSDSTIEASFRLSRAANTVLKGEVRYPGRLSLYPFAWMSEENGFWFEVTADSIALAEFDPLVPADISLGGALSMQLTGQGSVTNPSLNGRIVTRQLVISAAQRARITASSDIRISGDRTNPVIKGDVDVTQGLIQVPDFPPNVHPTEGHSMLLGDSISLRPAREKAAATSRAPAVNPEFDVTVRIPQRFFVRGNGLDLELGGTLRARQAGQKPEVVGELQAVRGRLNFLGRRLNLDEGSVRFTGGDEIDPELSVTLSAQINDTLVRVLFGGTVQKPAVFFSSEPEMDEGDIMAILLFGRPLDQLDDAQTNHIRQRATEVAVALGTAQLQQSMSGRFGVDVLTYEASQQEEQIGHLQFARYLNSRALLSYMRSLDAANESFARLEYFLTGRLKVQSIYGRKHSGLGVGWQRNY